MPSIEIVYSPSQLPYYQLQGKNVVVTDILRATTSMCAAMNTGAQFIVPVKEITEALIYRDKGYICAGERDGQKVEGFEKGNSPFDFLGDDIINKPIVITTTNGTQAIHASKSADCIYIGAFVNLDATVKKLIQDPKDLIILCAGWKNKYNLEDTLYAGALAQILAESNYHISDDAGIAAEVMYRSVANDLYGFIKKSAHAQRFERLGIDRDIEFCLQKSIYDIIPFVDKNGEIILMNY